MTYTIGLDDGHGDFGVTPGKRTPKFSDGTFMYENAFNKVVVKYLDEILRRCGFKTILVAPTDADTPLSTRVRTANNAKVDAYVSIHANAASGSWGSASGVETFVGASAMSKKLANNVHNQLIKGTSQKNRGVKDGTHLYVIRNTTMPAILVETAFMDNEYEAKLLLSDSFRRECAIEIAKGICETFGVKFVEDNKPEVKGVSVDKSTPKVEVKPKTTIEKEVNELEFSSPTLKEKLEMRVLSPATKELLVEKAVAELGYKEEWKTKHKTNQILEGDYMAMAYELAVYYAKYHVCE